MKRSMFEMSIAVLEIMEKISVPTKIMFAANMSWDRFMTIISGLKTVGLVKEMVLSGTSILTRPGRRNSQIDVETVIWKTNTRKQRRYSLTEKGREALSLVKNLNEMIEGLGIEREMLVPQ